MYTLSTYHHPTPLVVKRKDKSTRYHIIEVRSIDLIS